MRDQQESHAKFGAEPFQQFKNLRLQRDVERRSESTGYTALRRYVAVNRDRRAEMVVRVDCSSDGSKQFTTISGGGSSSIRKHVFYKMLNEESEASRRETRDGSRIRPLTDWRGPKLMIRWIWPLPSRAYFQVSARQLPASPRGLSDYVN